MNDLLLIMAGVAIGTYFAEPIREVIPLKRSSTTAGGTTNV